MQRDNSLRKAMYHLKAAKEYFEYTYREVPTTIGGKLSKKYVDKISWMENDFTTCPQLPRFAVEDYKNEMNGDTMFFESISRKALELSEKQKVSLENMLDSLISGEKITVVIN